MSLNTKEYYNRDLSWLRFNHRVLQEAMDFGDWTTYSPYLDYASTVVSSDEDGVILEGLHYKYLEVDEQETPSP